MTLPQRITCIFLSILGTLPFIIDIGLSFRHMSSSLKSVKVSVEGRSIHVVRRGNGPKVHLSYVYQTEPTRDVVVTQRNLGVELIDVIAIGIWQKC